MAEDKLPMGQETVSLPVAYSTIKSSDHMLIMPLDLIKGANLQTGQNVSLIP